jgi:hypothetical protein
VITVQNLASSIDLGHLFSDLDINTTQYLFRNIDNTLEMPAIFDRNDALDVNPQVGDARLSDAGSDWLWAVTAIFLVSFVRTWMVPSPSWIHI